MGIKDEPGRIYQKQSLRVQSFTGPAGGKRYVSPAGLKHGKDRKQCKSDRPQRKRIRIYKRSIHPETVFPDGGPE